MTRRRLVHDLSPKDKYLEIDFLGFEQWMDMLFLASTRREFGRKVPDQKYYIVRPCVSEEDLASDIDFESVPLPEASHIVSITKGILIADVGNGIFLNGVRVPRDQIRSRTADKIRIGNKSYSLRPNHPRLVSFQSTWYWLDTHPKNGKTFMFTQEMHRIPVTEIQEMDEMVSRWVAPHRGRDTEFVNELVWDAQ